MKTLTFILCLIASFCYGQKTLEGKILVDTSNNTAYLQAVVKVDSLDKKTIYKRAKQFIASTVTSNEMQLNYDSEEEGKLVFTNTQGLFFKQGFGTNPMAVKYSFTIEIKDGRYRYTVSNVEMAYATLIGAGQREVLYSEWKDCRFGTYGGRAYNRCKAIIEHVETYANRLLTTVKQNTQNNNSDF